MANTNFTLTPGTWTLLTSADVTSLRVQNWSKYEIFLSATVGETPPTSLDGAVWIEPVNVVLPDVELEVLWPGVPGANRVYAMSRHADAVLSVSHA